MAQMIDNTLEGRLAELESAMRSLRATNWTERTSVVNAEGSSVPLSSLAFGQAAATNTATVELWGTANAGPGGVGWYYGGPVVWVYVTGGRLRVDLAAALVASGNKCSAFMSYSLHGPALESGAAGTPELVTPAYDRSVEVQHGDSGMDQRLAAGTHGTHTGLPPGWYAVEGRYALSYSGSPSTPYGTISNRRVTATPY